MRGGQASPRAVTSSVLSGLVVPQQEPGNISSLTPAPPFLLRPALPAHEKKCFKFLSHLAAAGYPRARNECEGGSQRLSKHNYWKTDQEREKKDLMLLFSFRFMSFRAPSESRLRVMHTNCYWGMCFPFVTCRRGLFYLSRGWRRILSLSTTRGSGQKAEPRGEDERGEGKRVSRVSIWQSVELR